MVNLEHVSASLRLTSGDERTNVRTFSGVRRSLTASSVQTFMQGINSIRQVHATNAVLTARAAFVPE